MACRSGPHESAIASRTDQEHTLSPSYLGRTFPGCPETALNQLLPRESVTPMKSLVKILLVKAVLFLMAGSVAAQSTSIVTKALDRTAILVRSGAVTATSYGFDGSFGLTPLFNIPGLVGFSCLQPAGTKCIYRISIESSVTLNTHENFATPCVAAIHILVDKRAPTPGPLGAAGPGADSGGLYGVFAETVDPSSSPRDFRPATVSVIARVTNSIVNQLHAINMDLWVGGDCVATANGAIATIQVFH